MFLVAVVTAVACGQVIPEKAQQATRQGLEAVEKQQWLTAIEHFCKARWLAPWDPDSMFRLGLACDKAGQQLAAMCWYEAYLLAAPDADNAQEVRKRITALEAAIEKELKETLSLARDTLFATDPKKWRETNDIYHFFELCGRMGELDAANDVLGKLSPANRNRPRVFLAKGQAMAGDFAAAENTANAITYEYQFACAYVMIIQGMIDAGDVAGARALANSLEFND